MPELPEVESQRRDLTHWVLNRPIRDVWVGWRKTVARPSVDGFKRGLRGRHITKVERRGKFLIMTLDNGKALVSHFRMTGHFRLAPLAQSKSTEQWYVYPPDRFSRVAFKLAPKKGRGDPDVLHYSDIRKFGRLWLLTKQELATLPELGELGPEPLNPKLSTRDYVACLRQRRGMIKPVLLDQSCIAGIGNIYADESLFDAAIHPKTRVEKLSDAELATLVRMVRSNLQDAVGHGGSSVGEYVNMRGNPGRHGLYLRVYQQTGKPCGHRRGQPRGRRCAGTVKRIVVGQRGTHLCPVCQRPRR